MLYLYQPPVRGRFVLYILVPAYCTVRESFVRICTSFRWERDLNCTYWYQLTVRERLFKFVPAYGKREICTYWYQLLVREREREICIVHTCISLLWGRDLYIFAGSSYEIKISAVHTCTNLLRGRDLYIFEPASYWDRDLYIFVPAYCKREICEIEICTYL